MADMKLQQGAWPSDFAELAGDTGTVHAVQIHLCTKRCKASGTIVPHDRGSPAVSI